MKSLGQVSVVATFPPFHAVPDKQGSAATYPQSMRRVPVGADAGLDDQRDAQLGGGLHARLHQRAQRLGVSFRDLEDEFVVDLEDHSGNAETRFDYAGSPVGLTR